MTTLISGEDLEAILFDEQTNGALFDLSKGRVFRCHAIRRKSTKAEDVLEPDDVLIFNFHHAAFDGSSIDIFLRDLRHAYSTNNELKPSALDYIDYSVHEKEMNMDEARAFWKHHLDGFENKILPLPYDRTPFDNNSRSGRGATISFDLSQDITDRIVAYMQTTETTLFQLGLAAFYVFLFKLVQEKHLCVLTVSANRPRVELENIVGFFVNTVPHCLSVDPHSTFSNLVKCVKELALIIVPHTHLPYQDMISSTVTTTLQTAFVVETVYQHVMKLDSNTSLRPLLGNGIDPQSVAKFDFSCFLLRDVTRDTISICLNASSDLFDARTVSQMTRRFECLLDQLFSLPSSICELSLLLYDEVDLLRQLNTGDELLQSMHLLPIHRQFVLRVQEHPQKVALILDYQSLTYAELLHYTQLVALHLIDECHVKSGDIVGLCVERSIEMAIGMLGILLSGASYLPFWPGLPAERLHSHIELMEPHCLLIHSVTHHLFPSNGVAVDAVILDVNAKSIIERFPCVNGSIDNTAVILFTSGSTGSSKAVPISHRNLTQLIDSLCQLHLARPDDIIIQLASCSFDVHAYECMSSFTLGATLVLLRPHGNCDARYLCQTIAKSQATTIFFVPTSICILCEYLNSTLEFDCVNPLVTLKCVSTGGKTRCEYMIFSENRF
jgi:non-ribosomal peptide synthetase component F